MDNQERLIQKYWGACDLYQAGKKIAPGNYDVLSIKSDSTEVQFCAIEMDHVPARVLVRLLELAEHGYAFKLVPTDGKKYDIRLENEPNQVDMERGFVRFVFMFLKWYVEFK